MSCRHWLPSTSRDVIVSALSYSAIVEAFKKGFSAERMAERFKATSRTPVLDLMKKDMIIFPCKV